MKYVNNKFNIWTDDSNWITQTENVIFDQAACSGPGPSLF